MNDASKSKKAEKPVENLELNRETIQDLTEQEGDRARGGMIPTTSRPPACGGVCTEPETGCL